MTVAYEERRPSRRSPKLRGGCAAKLPGGARGRRGAQGRDRRVRGARPAASAHRGVEVHRPARSAAKTRCRRPSADKTPMSHRASSIVALGALARARRVPRRLRRRRLSRRACRAVGRRAGVEIGALGAALAHSRRQAAAATSGAGAATGQDAVLALNTAFMTDGAVVRVARGRRAGKAAAARVRARRQPRRRLVTDRNVVKHRRAARARPSSKPTSRCPARRRGSDQHADRDYGRRQGATLAHVEVRRWAGAREPSRQLDRHARGAGVTTRLPVHRRRRARAQPDLRDCSRAKAASSTFPAFSSGAAAEHIDTTLVVDHAVAACESRELFKGVLDDRARGVFQGKVIVRPDAQKTDGKQMAQALMLSEDAEFDSKPELEIFADDVVCGHGSTAAEIDRGSAVLLPLARHSRGRGPRAADRKLHRRGARQGRARRGLREALAAIAHEWLAAACDDGQAA